ncbi:MAG: HAMP domain-containing histidine kinase [Eubacteriales bacterium]|nr:HAMP domain-containing histidine kinase [Eubacteriales bacterium]
MTRWLRGMRLSVLFSFVVLLIFVITGLIMVAFALALLHLGVVDRMGVHNAFPLMMALLLASAIVGTFVSLAFGHIPLKPIQAMIDATNKLAAGDFSTRIQLNRPMQFRVLRDSFNRMAEELSSIELLRSDFINNFSHEFKTPIVSIKGFAELLKAEDMPAQERDEYLDIIIRESSRLASMATNVLNLSRYENQAIVTNRKLLNLSEQLRRCVLLLQSAWEGKNIELEVDLEEVSLYGNDEMLSQVWLNLLDNAVKFSRDGGRIVIRLTTEGDQADVIFRDYGAGIPEGELGHIFDKFYHSDADSAAPGNGLGLALARKIVRLHGGDITCESRAGEGAEFLVHLPLNGQV